MRSNATRRPVRFAWVTVGLMAGATAALCAVAYSAATQFQTSEEAAAQYMEVAATALKPVSSPRHDQDAFFVMDDHKPIAEVIVDLDRKRVTGVYHLASPGLVAGGRAATFGDCERAAYVEAARIYPEGGDAFTFDAAKAVPSEAKCEAYLFTWTERQDEAYTGKILNVSVWATAGEVRHTFLRLPPDDAPTAVNLTEAEAMEATRKALPKTGLAEAVVDSATLVLSSPLTFSEGPAWLVEVREKSGKWRDIIAIDAQTGQALRP